MRYVVIWSDGFPSTFYNSVEDAERAVSQMIERDGISGRVVSEEEYLKSSTK